MISLYNNKFQKHIIHSIAAQTLLIYDYGKKFKLNENQTISSFIKDYKTKKLDSTRKDALKYLNEVSPLGEVELFLNNNTTCLQVGITKSDTNKRITVIFRGSESRTDWLYDFMIKKIKINKNICVHSGFFHQLHNEDSFNIINNKLISLIHEYNDYDLYISGHSLGGALSTLYGFEFSQLVPDKIVNVLSFASPRVGDETFKNECMKQKNLNILRVTNQRDTITAVPMYNYKHVGFNLHLTNNMYILSNEYNFFKFSLFNCWNPFDHSMDKYYENIKNIK